MRFCLYKQGQRERCKHSAPHICPLAELWSAGRLVTVDMWAGDRSCVRMFHCILYVDRQVRIDILLLRHKDYSWIMHTLKGNNITTVSLLALLLILYLLYTYNDSFKVTPSTGCCWKVAQLLFPPRKTKPSILKLQRLKLKVSEPKGGPARIIVNNEIQVFLTIFYAAVHTCIWHLCPFMWPRVLWAGNLPNPVSTFTSFTQHRPQNRPHLFEYF